MSRLTAGRVQSLGGLLIGIVNLTVAQSPGRAAELLVADRLSDSVYRYSATGVLLGTVIDHSAAIYQPTGIGMSPDFDELYVSSSQLNQVLRYDYNVATGVATNPTIFADASDGLAFPNDIQFSPDGSIIYVANLGGGVARFQTNGNSAGSMLSLPDSAPTSSLVFAPGGKLLAGAFQDSSGTGGGIAISNSTVSAFTGFLVPPTPEISGATGLMIHEGYLYVSGLFKSNIRRFALADGQLDTSWGISGVGFPQDLALAPDGNGFLAGILGFAAGGGSISRYAFDGTLIGAFAVPSGGGFTEATTFVVVPTPLLGDYNGSGNVDAADYTVWRDNVGSSIVLPNDDTPGTVDASDYADWRANFGASSSASSATLAAAPIPEPAGLLLLCIAILVGHLIQLRIE